MLDPKRTRSNHTSEARRGERKPLLKLDWREKGLVGRPDCLDPYAFSKESDKFGFKASDRIKWLDYLSCFLSIIAFVLALWYGNSHPFSIELWDENVLVSPNTTMAVYQNLNASVNSTEVELRSAQLITGLELRSQSVEGFCYEKRSVYNIKRQWNNTVYVGSAIIEPAAWPGTVRPWYLLIWIFLVSIVFQGSRALNNDIDRRSIERYDPLKPDYWRWVEYALTSPFQVFLIATSVMIGERSQLLSLMGLQGALVMIGFANEKRIDKFYKRAIKIFGEKNYELPQGQEKPSAQDGDQRDRFRPQNKVIKLVVLMVMSWLFFALIWFIILSRFGRQARNLDDCAFADEMPWAVWFIVTGQLTLFAAFGLVQTWQVWRVFRDLGVYYQLFTDGKTCIVFNKTKEKFMKFNTTEDKKNYYESNKKKDENDQEELTDVQNSDDKKAFSIRKRKESWNAVALWYSLLSVLAKSLLEFGFIFLVTAQEDMVLSTETHSL
tara:strand:+ start:3640 stop:5121 length:1482 start_codon:yes stop_codon:yes gene_type:complete